MTGNVYESKFVYCKDYEFVTKRNGMTLMSKYCLTWKCESLV